MTEHDADSVSLPINDFKEIEQIELGADYVPARRDNPENAADDMTMTYMTAALLRLKRR